MPRTARSLAVAACALVVVAAAWLRLEQPLAPLWRVVGLVVLALAAATPSRRWQRTVASAAAVVAAARIGLGLWLVPSALDPGSGFGLGDSFSAVATRFGNGFSDFYGTHLPFDPRIHVAMGELVLAAIFIFSLAVALLARARKPVGGALAVLLGAAWPATLLGPSHGIAMGAAILGAALVVLAGLGSRRVPAFTLPAAVVVALAAVAVGSATAARHGLVHWQAWNLTHAGGAPIGVDFVWNAQYNGLNWPRHPTVVLQVQADQPPSFLRAAVLDDFEGDAWAIGPPRPADALEPPAALQPRHQTREIVTAEGLADTQLVGGSIPVRFSAGDAPLVEPERGFASLNQAIPRGFRYTVWSYAARPSPADLRRSPPDYPAVLADEGLLDVGSDVTMPRFGAPHRNAAVARLVARNPELDTYLPLARLADQVAGHARTPFDAVSRLENWFAVSGTFRYSNHPLVIAPPLVEFVTDTRVGYCQYFAGAMALMLRYLGIPARVAVGFASGTENVHRHVWVVTDHEAHAWVEVWFKGYGWLPFDPTPDAPGAPLRPALAGAGGGFRTNGNPLGSSQAGAKKGGSAKFYNDLGRKDALIPPRARHASSPRLSPRRGSDGRRRPLLLLLLVLVAAGGGVVLAKAGVRTLRRSYRDPRRAAAACRAELASFLIDQRVEAPGSATLRELGELVQGAFGANPEPFVAAATTARFARLESAAAAVPTLRRELRVLLDSTRRSLTRRERLRGLFSLRSLARPTAAVDASASLRRTGT